MTEPQRCGEPPLHDWRISNETASSDGYWWYCTKCRKREKVGR